MIKRYEPEWNDEVVGYGQFERCDEGDLVKHKDIEQLEHDIFVLVLRLMGEDKSTHSPDTLAVLDRWVPAVCVKMEHI